MAIGGFSKSRNILARKRLQKRNSVRRVLLETLEARQLLAVGPQLIGIQPDSGDLLSPGDVLNVSPRELVFRFSDNGGIDESSLGGIRVIRSGADGIFDRASIATDFGTNGQTLVEFYAQEAGQAGNGIELKFTSVSRNNNRAPVLRVTGRTINIELNSNPALETRVEDLLQAFNPENVTPATNLVYALRLRGSQTIGVGRTVDTTRSLFLSGANSAKGSTNFGLTSALEVRFVARETGSAGVGVTINFSTSDPGAERAPVITVAGQTVSVLLNSNPRFTTTARQLVDAINASPAFELIEAQLVSGSGATRIGASPTAYSPVTLSGVSDIEIVPGYIGLGDSGREVILRFSEPLPDDKYRIEIMGTGLRTLVNVDGEAFNAGVSRSIPFELNLGVQILSVVPQPVTRNPTTGALSWTRTADIDVYFSEDKLIDVSKIASVNGMTLAQLTAQRHGVLYLQNSDTIVFRDGSTAGVLNPQFYQLINSNGTLTTADDAPAVFPSLVRYYPNADRVTLQFQRNLDQYASGVGGELRLRVGTTETPPMAPVIVDAMATEPGSSFADALDLSTTWTPAAGTSQSVIVNSKIENSTPFVLDFPGGSDEPGNRRIRMQDNLRLGADTVDGITTFFYNFQGQLGSYLNAITEQQKIRVREVFSLYERYLGVRFVESANQGLTIAVGDLRAVIPFPDIPGGTTPGATEPNQPGFTAYEAGTLASGQLATVLDSQDFSSSLVNEFGGTFTRAAMQAIGKLLGLGDADELEQLTIQSFNSVFAPGVGTEMVFPGDGDIVHGQFLYRPDSKDIDLYQFSVPVAGKMSIETFAERMSSASLLDTHLRLFQETPTGWEEIAANDDYFSSDSYIELTLAAGNYIVGVSASGNASYDGTISDGGLGGLSQGNYQLRMDFTPPAPSVMRDADTEVGTPIDGNGDGIPGGVFDFWFRPSSAALNANGTTQTKFVDKSSTAALANGLISSPYKTIAAAIQAAAPGDVIRVLGNGGADRDFATQSDNLAYEIGFNSLGNPLPDGATLDVPKDVTLMIDAGAILKLRRARIGVGSSSVSVDRSGSALLVLGTPTLQTADGRVLTDAAGNPLAGSVVMTSLNDTSLGQTVTPAGALGAGDWGGLDFRNRIDTSNNRNRLEDAGVFLNWVSNADIRFGGGQVVVDGSSQVVTPIQMVDARPTIMHNTITRSADAAMSATPDSFLESNFHSPAEQGTLAPFTVDYDRIGPDIRGNRVLNNTINGLQVRVTTRPGTQLEKLTTQGRFNDTSIVHYLPENLEIQGTPGGAILQSVGGTSTMVSRLDARLVIDPGTIIKSQGSRIDVAFGGQLIAEGTDGSPIVFTSLNDIRYGAGGTFDTANRVGQAGTEAEPGDWGGIYVGHTSSASFDHAVISYGGGTTRVAGGFANFNALEVHQADVRLTHSRLELNADGATLVAASQRSGRGSNEPATVFVRGAQPIVVNNIIRENEGAALSFNVSSLNSDFVEDTGRSRGALGLAIGATGNQGPLVSGNRLEGNGINGMHVRGGVLTTEGVWDDTDMVHVVTDEVIVPDFHAFGGLRLESSPTQSLVVKFRSSAGETAGLTATGNRLDNANRIGGAIQLLGQPGLPVILTSLNDSSVGAGFSPSGDPQFATVAGTAAAAGDWRSVLLDTHSNDRNVQSVVENESYARPGTNDTPSNPQFLGGLAPTETSGDENRRLGYQIHGAIHSPTDRDVYSFEAQAGTEVWFDIDRTSHSLDSVLELIDANGRVLAASHNSLAEEADPSLLFRVPEIPAESVNPLRLSSPELYLQSATGAPKDLYSTNPRDAGFRVSLPGAAGTSNLYHLRVRSAGGTQGHYQLQVRLSEVDEVPGSSINYVDLRFAQSGIQLVGVPLNSPLLGENSETAAANDTIGNAQVLGNLLQTNRQAISVAGNLDSNTDVDWYSFTIDYQRIRPTSIREYFATVFDVDYADGLGRPDISFYVFNAAQNLILSSHSSNVVDDQASPIGGADNADLTRGSAGTLDPYIDSYELPAGQYFIAVTNSSRMPQVMNQFTNPASGTPLVRLQPIEGVQLIAEEHVDFNGGSTASGPVVPDLFTSNAEVAWNLGDIVLYVSRDAGAQTNLYMVNPFTGQVSVRFDNPQGFDVEDIAFRPNGQLRAFDRAVLPPLVGDLDNQIDYIDIDPGTGAFTVIGASGLQTFHREFSNANPPVPAAVDSNDGVHPEAITFAMLGGVERGFFVGSRPTPAGVTPDYFGPPLPLPNVGTGRPGPSYYSNVLYEFDEVTGAALGTIRTDLQQFQGAGTSVIERAYIETRNTTGAQPTQLFAREVTTTQAGQLVEVIQDGDTFTLFNPAGPPFNWVFEFDLGAEARVNYNPAAGFGIRDGMSFTINGVNYEFDTGSVVVVDALSGNQLADGTIVRIQNASGVERVFEFDSNNSLTSATNIRVPFTAASSQASLVNALVTAVNSTGFGVRAESLASSNRISFVGASATAPVVVSGTGLSVDGVVGATGVRIPLSEAATEAQFVAAIAAAMPNNIQVGFESGRLNFAGATSADFGDLESDGIFVDQNSTGASPFNTVIRVLANDTAETVARRIVVAVNGLGFAGLSATSSGDRVQLFGATVANPGSLQSGGVAPGGIVTGIAVIGNALFAVSDAGGLYRVNNPQFAQGVVNGYVTTSSDLLGINFTGLVAGPANTSLTGTNERLLFGIDSDGVIYAFNTRGELQPVFANGATSVRTNLGGANGLALSTLQTNLWTTTNSLDPNDNTNRENDPGHGLPGTPNDSRFAVNGGSSFYFGNATDVNYNFPGGAAGAMESVPFSLAGLSAADMPMLYFSYLSANENVNGFDPRDAFRVYASGEDGNWLLLATNNTDPDAELRLHPDIQPLFDQSAGVTTGWRQARVPLNRLAGQENVKLRIEFSTGAGFGFGRQGGQGPEIRTIAGSRLFDGQAMTIQGERFELEMGPSLTLPGGSALSHGDSVTVDGVRYVFTDGTGPAVVAPDVPVAFNAAHTPAEIAQALGAAISAAAAVVPVQTGFTFGESNDIISRANQTGTTGQSVRITGMGEIGDRLSSPDQDVDLVRIDVQQGARVTVNVATSTIGSTLDSYLRVFDAAGRQVAATASMGGGNSQLTLTDLAEGAYFIGVSGAGNQTYDAVIPGLTAAGSTGTYELSIEIRSALTPFVSGNRLQIQGANLVSVGSDTPIVMQGATGTNGVPVRVHVGMSTAQVTAALQAAIADYFAGGRTAAYPSRGGDTLNLTGLRINDGGPFGVTTAFQGQQFTTFNSPLRAQNNNFEGIYVDDIIIGVAGRGEMVLGQVGANTTFVADPNATTQILTGPYQFEIRGGAEYGMPNTTGIALQETFTLAERSGAGLSIRFNAASQLVAGTTFTVGDGPRVVTFELDDVNDGTSVAANHVALPFNAAMLDPLSGGFVSESAEIIAARFRDLLNSPLVQLRINIAANLLNNDRFGATSDTVVLIGNATALVPASVGERIVSTRNGGGNRVRPQGQVVINAARISDSAGFGMTIDAAPRDPVTGAPLTGAPRNTITLNSDALAAGAVVMNSEFIGNAAGGIRVSGDAQLQPNGVLWNGMRAFVRLVNNTVVGGSVTGADETFTAGGTGIQVAGNATATLLNNVVVNSSVGISVDASSSSTVIGGSVFYRNTNNVGGVATVGQFPTIVPNSTRVFESIANGNLYPAASSPVIDSSIDSLEDRPSLVAVKGPLGIAPSPILAPLRDIHGQLRVDDPNVETPAGLGERVFKDRGAQDRADFSGPSVKLINPVDNDAAGLDGNAAETVVELSGGTLRYFDINILDGLEPSDPSRGVGVNSATVSSATVLLYGPKVGNDGVRRQNQPLVEGLDYRFGYDSTNGIIRLTPLAGIWESEAVYTIRFLNDDAGAFVLPTTGQDGDRFSIVDSRDITTTFELEYGSLIQIPSLVDVDLETLDGSTFIVDDGAQRVVFELDRNSVVATGNRAVNVAEVTTAEALGRVVETAIREAAFNLTITEVSSGLLQLQGARGVTFDPVDSGMTVTGQPGVQPAFGLQIPLRGGVPTGLTDGQTFTITRGTGAPVVFEFDTNGVTQPTNIPVRYLPNATAATIGATLVTAINGAALGLTASYAGSGLVVLGGDETTVLGLADTVLTQAGVAGQAASVAIPISAAGTTDFAAVLKSAIDAQNLPGVVVTKFGNRLVVEGAESVSGVGAQAMSAIQDLAGNVLKANQLDGSTTLTIFMGDGLDYGDAYRSSSGGLYQTTSADGGPSHRVIDGLSLGPTVTVDADARIDDADLDDGVIFTSGFFAGFTASAEILVTNTTGRTAYVSLWIDFNGDGVFAPTERFLNAQAIVNPVTAFSVLVPSTAMIGETFMRVRLSTDPTSIASPITPVGSGPAPDGEVEDHRITISGNPFTNPNVATDPNAAFDVNNDGFVSPIDILQVINWYNDPSKPRILTLAAATGQPPFVDVNGDGMVSPLDILRIINFLNARLASGGEGEAEGEFSGGDAGLLNAFGSLETTVLASDWAAGLETVLVSNKKPVADSVGQQHPNDLAILTSDDRLEYAFAGLSHTNDARGADTLWAELAGQSEDEHSADEGDTLVDALLGYWK